MSSPDDTDSPDPLDAPEALLEGLGERLLDALRAREAGDVDRAAELLRGILKVEPRLAEPRLELARVLLDTGNLEEAEDQAEEAVRILESGGQWTDDLPENVLLSLAFGLLGEIRRQRSDSDEVVFGDPAEWERLVNEAKDAFKRAYELDPGNEHAAWWALGFDPSAAQHSASAEDDGEEGDDGDEGEDDDGDLDEGA